MFLFVLYLIFLLSLIINMSRSLKKGPFVASCLLKKVNLMNAQN